MKYDFFFFKSTTPLWKTQNGTEKRYIHSWFSILFIILFFNIPILSITKSTKDNIQEYTGTLDASFFNQEDRKIRMLFSAEEQLEKEADAEKDTVDDRIILPEKLPYNDIAGKKIIYPSKKSNRNYRVKKGDTLYALSRKFGASEEIIKKNNHLKSTDLKIGATLKIPVVVKSRQPTEIVYKKVFIYPVQNARTTSTYGRRRNPFNRYSSHFHAGIDLAGSIGTPAIAAADGIVEFSGRNGGYGNTVILLHNNGIKTVYAHLSRIKVKEGEKVLMGRVIGAVGRTGVATAAHLHFAVLKKGRFINPAIILRQRVKIVRALYEPRLAGL